MTDVTVPQLGESVTEGTITKWLVKEGDVVVKDQPIAEIATDKADSELPAPTGGRVTKLLAKEGDVVPVRTVICQIDESAAGATQPHRLGQQRRRAEQRGGRDRPDRHGRIAGRCREHQPAQ